jgi:alpha-mannosidase
LDTVAEDRKPPTMDENRLEARLNRALRDRIEPVIHRDAVPLAVAAWHAPGEPVQWPPAGAEYQQVDLGTAWGPAWSTTWFRFRGTVPDTWPDGAVEAVVDLGFDARVPGFQAEGLAYLSDGTPLKGVAPRTAWVPVTPGPDRRVEFFVEAAANPDLTQGWSFTPTRQGDVRTRDLRPLYRLARAELALRDSEVAELLADIRALDGLRRELAPDAPRRMAVARALERMLGVLDPHDVSGTASAARAELRDALAAPAHASAHSVVAVGHAHIDSAWLWPVRETIRKASRTFSNVVTLMDGAPDFAFACSQAQQWEWIKNEHPKVWQRMLAKVRTGQFVPAGGMWVESDTNMPGGEALARQFLLGKQFFRAELGVETREVWLPDSFGYSPALPQIASLAGCRWMLTTKMSWNDTNRLPHHTFWWEGLDGSRLFTHLPPVETYNSELSAAELAHASRTFTDHGRASVSLVPFGWGDGGGGPTREMLDAARRTADLEASPRVRLGSPEDFFRRAESEYPDAPVWRGELYLELHRGTYTSQARTKQGNRRSEHLLREAELWLTTAAVRGLCEYPYDELTAVWKQVLLNQFHDILPGSSIAWVHREAEAAYADVAARLTALIERAQAALGGAGDLPLLFNAAPYERDGVASLAAAQPEVSEPGTVEALAEHHHRLSNGVVAAIFDENGLLTSFVDLARDRDAVPAGERGNLLQLHRDVPSRWDAWDLDRQYRDTVQDLTAATVVESSGERLIIRRAFGKSAVAQQVWLEPGRPWLRVRTQVDWQERDALLKLAFPLDVHAERHSAETQFGHLERPTHQNTSWDEARYEVCAHRWIHVAEHGFGVALANATTYGHDVTRRARSDGGTTTVLRASLLRAPSFPDPGADRGEHAFEHLLVLGDVGQAIEAGYALNLPPRIRHGEHAVAPLVALVGEGAVVEAVKMAEDRSGDVIVRIYESRGGRADVEVRTADGLGDPVEVDLLERPRAEGTAITRIDGTRFRLRLRPFQIVTVRLTPGTGVLDAN